MSMENPQLIQKTSLITQPYEIDAGEDESVEWLSDFRDYESLD
jgi:hypothetical protein